MVTSTIQDKSDDFVVLYASQTGNAEWIAKNILQEAREKGFQGEIYVLNDHEKVSFPDLRTIVFVTSNTGDGDPPDNSSKFWKLLRRNKDKDLFAHARFTILGLGDTNYSNFNNTGKKLEKKIKELGGTVFYEKGLADDAEGLETIVEPWIANLWPKLADVCMQKPKSEHSATVTTTKQFPTSDPEADISAAISKYLHLNDSPVDRRPETKTAELATTTTAAPAPKSQSTTTPPLDPYSFNGRAQEIPPGIEKYLELPGSLISKAVGAVAMPLPTGHKLHIDASALASATELTALPRIPGAVCKLTRLPSATPTSSNTTLVPSFVQTPSPIMYTTLRAARCLTTVDAVKRTLHVELALPEGQEVYFEPGDAFGIVAPNEEGLVKAVAARLGLGEGEAKEAVYSVEREVENVELPSHLQKATSVTVTDLLTYGVDLTTPPRKAMLRMLAEYTSDAEEKKLLLFLCSKQGTAQFTSLRDQSPTLLDLLATFPSCHPPLTRLLDTLPAHQPRSYSVASAPILHPRSLHFAFNVVRYTTPDPYNLPRQGVATPWLDTLAGHVPPRNPLDLNPPMLSLAAAHPIPVVHRPNAHAFTPPLDTTLPLILVGPGTGVAPYIGFLQHRKRQRQIRVSMGGVTAHPGRDVEEGFGDIWVFYGCREKGKDWLFREEMEGFVSEGIVKVLEVVASREGNEEGREKYVQDAMRRRGKELWELIKEKGACIYVCGDAKGMARDVHDALTDIVVEHGGQVKTEAVKTLTDLMQSKRYLRDLWA